MIDDLARISRDPDRLVRLFLTPEHRRAADLVGTWMESAGAASVTEDALGTVRGSWGLCGGPRLVLGSHLDTVVDAGRFDGALGVVAAILAAGYLARRGRAPPFGIDVLAFGDEEGSRFPATLSSSAAVAGVFDPATLDARDADGVSFGDALLAYGKDPAAIADAAYPRGAAAAYLELHIEQGPVLESEDAPLGIVTGIVGQFRARVALRGVAGHAGTVPMALRRDALAGAAELVLALEALARAEAQNGVVATVGSLRVFPGAGNVIPAAVEMTLDIRAMTDDARRALLSAWRKEADAVAAARGLSVSLEPVLETTATPCDPRLQARLAAAVAALGAPIRFLPSGAGHDAQVMARLCPAAMLFVRCRGGISHNPAEFASRADMGLGVAALIRFIADFDPSSLDGPS